MAEQLKVWDRIECDVQHPEPRTIVMVLETSAAVAFANTLLENPASGWRRSASSIGGVPVVDGQTFSEKPL